MDYNICQAKKYKNNNKQKILNAGYILRVGKFLWIGLPFV